MGCVFSTVLYDEGNINGYVPGIYFEKPKMNNNNTYLQSLLAQAKSYQKFVAANPIDNELFAIIQRKLQAKGNAGNIQLIGQKEVHEAILSNPFATAILQSVEKHLLNIIPDEVFMDAKYFNMAPIAIIDSVGQSEIYAGDYNCIGEYQGKGIWIFPTTKQVYAGSFKNDKFDGKGILILGDGDYYLGDFKDGIVFGNVKHGRKGVIIYEGQMQNFIKNGIGLERYEDGSIYKGEFVNGIREGQGYILYSDNSAYKGKFKNAKFEGYGTYQWSNGDIYEGQFYNGKFNGNGTIKYSNGNFFEGKFVNGKKQGEGTMKDKDGTIYKGLWHNNYKNGMGTIKDKNGERRVKYNFGKLISESDNL